MLFLSIQYITLKHLLAFEIFAREIRKNFVHKHSQMIQSVKI